MQGKRHFQLLATYNQRMNEQVYAGGARLSGAELERDAGAFFGSVLGTLNHIMVADLIWLRRFAHLTDRYRSLQLLDAMPRPAALDQILYPKFAELREQRSQLDRLIQRWINDEVREKDLDADLTYANTKGVVSTRNFGELLAHFFNHQTHHRGQAGTLLHQYGQDIGVTDFLLDIPDQQG